MLTDTMSTSTFTLRWGSSRLSPAGLGTPSRGSYVGHRRWHTHGESARSELSTRPKGVPTQAPPGRCSMMSGVDLDAFRWLLTDAGQQLLERAAAAPEDPLRASAALRKEAAAEHV